MSIRTKWMALLIGVLTALMLACQSSTQQTESETTPKETAGEAPPEQKITVSAGTALEVRLVEGLDTGKTTAGARFEGTLASPLVADGVTLAPVGSAVAGKVAHVVSSGRLNRPAEISLVLTSLTPRGGSKVGIATLTWSRKGKSHKKRNVEMIGGGTGAGALIGAIAGGKKGAAIGAAIGAGGGTGLAATTGKQEIVLPSETKLTFKLKSPVTFTFRG